MSRYFATSADHLDNAFPLTTTPFTMSAWVRVSTTAQQQVMSMGTTGSGNQRWTMGMGASGGIQALTRDTASTNANTTFPAYNTWVSIVGVWGTPGSGAADDTNRYIFTNGTNKVADVLLKTITAPNGLRISGDNGGGNVMQGILVAHLAIWNIALADADVLALYTNQPNLVQPGNLVEYWPLTSGASPEPSSGSGGHSLTVTGTTFSPEDPFGLAPLLMGQAVF